MYIYPKYFTLVFFLVLRQQTTLRKLQLAFFSFFLVFLCSCVSLSFFRVLLIVEMKSMGFDDNKFRNHTNNADCCYPFFSFYKNNQRIVTFLACFIFFGIVYCFYIPGVTLLSPVLDSETETDFFVNKTLPPVALLPESGDSPAVNESQASSPETYNSQGSQDGECISFFHSSSYLL